MKSLAADLAKCLESKLQDSMKHHANSAKGSTSPGHAERRRSRPKDETQHRSRASGSKGNDERPRRDEKHRGRDERRRRDEKREAIGRDQRRTRTPSLSLPREPRLPQPPKDSPPPLRPTEKKAPSAIRKLVPAATPMTPRKTTPAPDDNAHKRPPGMPPMMSMMPMPPPCDRPPFPQRPPAPGVPAMKKRMTPEEQQERQEKIELAKAIAAEHERGIAEGLIEDPPWGAENEEGRGEEAGWMQDSWSSKGAKTSYEPGEVISQFMSPAPARDSWDDQNWGDHWQDPRGAQWQEPKGEDAGSDEKTKEEADLDKIKKREALVEGLKHSWDKEGYVWNEEKGHWQRPPGFPPMTLAPELGPVEGDKGDKGKGDKGDKGKGDKDDKGKGDKDDKGKGDKDDKGKGAKGKGAKGKGDKGKGDKGKDKGRFPLKWCPVCHDYNYMNKHHWRQRGYTLERGWCVWGHKTSRPTQPHDDADSEGVIDDEKSHSEAYYPY